MTSPDPILKGGVCFLQEDCLHILWSGGGTFNRVGAQLFACGGGVKYVSKERCPDIDALMPEAAKLHTEAVLQGRLSLAMVRTQLGPLPKW